MLEETGLQLNTFEPYGTDQHTKRVPLSEAAFYLTRLVPTA